MLHNSGVTESLARLVVQTRWEDLPPAVRHQAKRSFMNFFAVALAGCPTGPAEIGLDWPRLKASYALARTIRRRYTVLDLAVETGILAECVDELFAAAGYWGEAIARAGA